MPKTEAVARKRRDELVPEVQSKSYRPQQYNIDDLENPPATLMLPNRVSAADSDDDSQEMDTSDLSDDDESSIISIPDSSDSDDD